MKKDGRDMKYVNYLCVWCLAMVLFACQEESLEQSGKTGFLVSLTDGMEVAVSRATPGELKESLPIEAKDFDLTITGSSTGETAYSGKVSEGLIPVKAGVYNLTATYGENPVLALDAPYFKGEMEKAIVRGGETTSVEIPCKVANSLLSVTFDNSKESFEDIYSDYSVEVKVGEESVTLKKDGKESAYFRADSGIEVIFHGTLKEDEGVKTVSLDLSGIKELPLQAGDHLKLTLMPELDKYDIPLSVEAAEVVTVTLEETIPLSWLPKPKVSAEGFDENNTLTFVETETKTARLNLGLSSALQDMKLKFNFEDEQFSSLQKDKEYLLSNAEDKAAVEAALGITLPEIGATEAGIDLSGVVSRMQTDAGATVNNTIEVDVKANDRWSSEDENANRVYKLVCNKPVFRIDAYPGNIWTKEFTVNALREEQVESGNFSAISESITYQYSTDQSEWFALSDGMRQDKLKPGTTYYIRGLYRGVIPGEVVEVTTYPETPLENGGLEGARITIGEDGAVGKDRGARYAWGGWATTNPLTTPNCSSAAYSFNSRSGVRPTSDKPLSSEGSEAVRIITTSYGYGGTYNNPKYFMHSELFLGTEPEEDNDNRSYGIEFLSHPTGLSFDYKCVSNVGNDESEVRIELYKDNILLGSKIFQTGAKDKYERITLSIDYIQDIDKLKLEPNRLVVVFKSGTKKDLSKDDLKKMFGTDIPLFGNIDTTADCMWRGNELFIDDVELVYDK